MNHATNNITNVAVLREALEPMKYTVEHYPGMAATKE